MVNKKKKKGKKNNQNIRKYGLLQPLSLRSNVQLQPSPLTIVNKSQLISQLFNPPTSLNSPFPQKRLCDSQILALESNPPDLPQICYFSQFPDLRVLSWNINGLQNKEKLKICKRMATSSWLLFIFLQETYATSENDLDHLKNHLRKYIWFHNFFSKRKHGLVIGIRCVEELKDPSPFCFEKNEGRLFGLKVFIQNQEFSALNVYHHPGLKLKHLMEESSWFFSPQNKNILVGDLNWNLNETNCQKLIEHLSDLNLSCLNWLELTHFQGQYIDHIFFLSKAPEDHLFVNAIPFGFKDHTVMIGGASVKE